MKIQDLIGSFIVGSLIVFLLYLVLAFKEPETPTKEKTCINYPESKVTICAHNHEEYKVYE